MSERKLDKVIASLNDPHFSEADIFTAGCTFTLALYGTTAKELSLKEYLPP